MPRTGRPPKPVELKRKLGNPGQRPLPKHNVVALAPAVLVPATPDPDTGEEFISRILATPASAWIAESDRLGLLTLLRKGWDERSQLERAVAAGAAPRKDLRDLDKQITAWLSLLGLSPTDRSRLGVAEVKARTKLEELRARREARGLRSG